jgi:hypothetical protein
VSALAVQSFEAFAAAFRRVLVETSGSHLDRIRAIGVAYIRFAFEDPTRFVLMWRPELRSVTEDPAVDEAGLASYQVLIDEVAAGQASGEVRDGDVGLLSLSAWSMVHGFATLVVDGPLRDQVTTWTMVEPLLEPVLDTVLRGVATHP